MKHAGGRPQKEIRIDPAQIPHKDYYTVADIVEYTGLYKETIQARLRDGTIHAKKLNGRWLIYPESLQQFYR